MIADKLDQTIKIVENYFFGNEGDCGEQLFINFSKEHTEQIMNVKLSESTENRIEFTFLHEEFQSIFEKKLEELINLGGMNIEEFHESLKKRCDENDQEIILFVDILNAMVDYNSFIEMMANIINKV